MEPNSSEDATRAMRGQASDFLETWRERHFICFDFVSQQRCFLHSQFLFVRPGFRLFCAHLAVQYLAVYSVSESLVRQTLTVAATNAVVV